MPRFGRRRFEPALLGMPGLSTEADCRARDLLALGIGDLKLGSRVTSALIIENEISYLSVPVPVGGVVIWGRGYDADVPSSLDWLQEADVLGRVSYWGDIDTHGFAILNRVRSHLPHVRSVMMDRDTLLAHSERWGTEMTPTNAVLDRLTKVESTIYEDLVTGRYGSQVRLEQERIDWAWVVGRLDPTNDSSSPSTH